MWIIDQLEPDEGFVYKKLVKTLKEHLLHSLPEPDWSHHNTAPSPGPNVPSIATSAHLGTRCICRAHVLFALADKSDYSCSDRFTPDLGRVRPFSTDSEI